MERIDIATVYQVGGELGAFVCSRLNSIFVSRYPISVELSFNPNNCVYVNDGDFAFQMLMRGGDNSKSMFMDLSYVKQFQNSHKLAAISSKCTNMESNMLPGHPNSEWLQMFGARLKGLEFHNQQKTHQYEAYCFIMHQSTTPRSC